MSIVNDAFFDSAFDFTAPESVHEHFCDKCKFWHYCLSECCEHITNKACEDCGASRSHPIEEFFGDADCEAHLAEMDKEEY